MTCEDCKTLRAELHSAKFQADDWCETATRHEAALSAAKEELRHFKGLLRIRTNLHMQALDRAKLLKGDVSAAQEQVRVLRASVKELLEPLQGAASELQAQGMALDEFAQAAFDRARQAIQSTEAK